MRIKVTKPYDLHINTNEKGRPLATVAFTPSDEPVTVKREWGEALIAAKAGVEVKEPVKRAD